MPTPAEIIAARYSVEPEEVIAGAVASNGASSEVSGALNGSKTAEGTQPLSVGGQNGTNGFNKTSSTPKLLDESAFPVLGGSGSVGSTPSWGPRNGNSGPVGASKSGSVKLLTIQEAFSLDAEDQVNVLRPEFVKLITSIRNETNTNIECTTSQHTKKRTFLIAGRPVDVKAARKLVVRKLTRPVLISFEIPAKLRLKVIGPQGRVLKPIISENVVKIDIGLAILSPDINDSDDLDDDEYSQKVTVVIDGDAEGSSRAKAQILAIVRQETKNLTTRIPLDPLVKPFAIKTLAPLIKSNPDLEIVVPDHTSSALLVLVTGERELVLKVKKDIITSLAVQLAHIVVDEVDIPLVKRQFLPVDQILQDYDVLVKVVPNMPVQFIGSKKAIASAQNFARQTTSLYKVEVLDMAKAHKGNIAHVKAVALYLEAIGAFKKISKDVGVSVNVPSKESLYQLVNLIPIEIVEQGLTGEATKAARKAIVATVNKITPEKTRVIEDIDAFLMAQVGDVIGDICGQEKINFVTLGNRITLFSGDDDLDEADFDDDDKTAALFDAVDAQLASLRTLSANLSSHFIKASPDQQKLVKGKTLGLVLSEVPKNSVEVTFEPEGITVHGTKIEATIIEKSIRAILADHQEHGTLYSNSVAVPVHILPRFVGKSGSNLRVLRDTYDVKIEVPDADGQTQDKNAKAEVSVIGAKKNVELAIANIQEFSKRWADETVSRIRIEEKYHGKLIGPNGVFLNRLQNKYNVKIRFPAVGASQNLHNDSNPHPDAPRNKDEVVIKGPSRGVAKAEEELSELVAFEKENGFKKTLTIPSAAVLHIIGKQGETIKDISDGTGAEYKFRRDGEAAKNGFIELELTGTKAALQQATEKVNEIVAEVERYVTVTLDIPQELHRHLIGPGGSIKREIIKNANGEDVARDKYNRLLAIPGARDASTTVTCSGDKDIVDKIVTQVKAIVAKKVASVTESYELPKEKHRFIIGQQGSIRQGLQTKHDVIIEVPRENDSLNAIKIEGLPENIAAAIAEIKELTKDDWSEELLVPRKYHALVSERGAAIGWLHAKFNVDVLHGPASSVATEISKSAVPTPPEDAAGEDGKFTVVEGVDLSQEDTTIPWRLKGKPEDAKKAKANLEGRLARAKEAEYTAWYWVENTSLLSKLIGPRGQTLNLIREKTGTFITAPRTGDKNDQFVYLVGTKAGLDAAAKEFAKRR